MNFPFPMAGVANDDCASIAEFLEQEFPPEKILTDQCPCCGNDTLQRLSAIGIKSGRHTLCVSLLRVCIHSNLNEKNMRACGYVDTSAPLPEGRTYRYGPWRVVAMPTH